MNFLMFFLRARAFVCGVGAGFDQLSVGIKYLGEPAPCIFKETGFSTVKPVLQAPPRKYKETTKVSGCARESRVKSVIKDMSNR
ncbi:MAG: hypothetical protein RLZZ338_2272 [Cyanobacteriota bacterium]